MIGDADDGYVVTLSQAADFCPYRSLLATAAVLLERHEFKAKAHTFDDKSRWLLGADGAAVLRSWPQPRPSCRVRFLRAVTTYSAPIWMRRTRFASWWMPARSATSGLRRTAMRCTRVHAIRRRHRVFDRPRNLRVSHSARVARLFPRHRRAQRRTGRRPGSIRDRRQLHVAAACARRLRYIGAVGLTGAICRLA